VRDRRALRDYLDDVRRQARSRFWRLSFLIDVRPEDHRERRWVWTVSTRYNGRPGLTAYTLPTWRRPTPCTLRGRARAQDDAWRAARAVVAAANEVLAQEAHVDARAWSERA
jgi:hypothetical protein